MVDDDEVCMDHDYASAPDPAAIDLALDDNMSLRKEIHRLREQVEKLTMNPCFGIHRFASLDKDIRFFSQGKMSIS